MDAKRLEELGRNIDKTVDDWLSGVVKDRFLRKPIGHKPRSLWDRLKQGVTNWWWGPKGDKYNPYVWKNRFGDELGSKDVVSGDPRSKQNESSDKSCFDPSIFTLEEYMEIRGLVDSIEMRIDESFDSDANFDNLRLMSLLRAAAVELKKSLRSVVKRHLGATESGSPQSPESGSPQSPESGSPQSPKSGSTQSPKSGSTQSPKSGSPQSPKSRSVPAVKKIPDETRVQKKAKLEYFFREDIEVQGRKIRFNEMFYKFIEFYMKKYDDKKIELRKWFADENKKINKLNKSDAEDLWHDNIVKSDKFIDEISKIVEVSADDVLDDMVKYIDSKNL